MASERTICKSVQTLVKMISHVTTRKNRFASIAARPVHARTFARSQNDLDCGKIDSAKIG